MGNLYLIDRPFGENGVNLALRDAEALAVLIQDGVYLDVASLLTHDRRVLALRDDVDKRGLDERMANGVELISYSELVDLIVTHKVINFA
ncbi:MAG: DsrH/TusB family sulfur metabolism protein [Candidatus Methylomirabilales bacterium]